MVSSPNQGSLPFETNNCEVSQGKILSINPLEAQNVKKFCEPTSIDKITCKNPLCTKAAAEVNGLGFSDIVPKFKVPFSLIPKIIPVIDRGVLKMSGVLDKYEMIGVSLDDIFVNQINLNGGHLYVPNIDRINLDLLNSPALKGKKVFLSSTGKDKLIESIWRFESAINFYQKIRQLGISVATAFNFSIFFEECPFTHHLNEKKSLVTFKEYQSLGIPSIPHVYWANKWQLADWIEWLKKYPEVEIITINCQCYKSRRDQEFAIEGIKKLFKTLPHLHILLEGGVKLLPGLLAYADRIHLSLKQPTMEALARQRFVVVNEELITINDRTSSKEDLINSNFAVYEKFILEKYFTPVKVQSIHKSL